MFGCYRKGDANDADTYVAAVSAVLAGYSLDVIRLVTDPRSGLPRRHSFMPTVKEVADECEVEQQRADSVKRFSGLKRVPRLPGPPQHRANVFVPATAPQYPAMVEKAKTADKAEWRLDDCRPGMWVIGDWLSARQTGGFNRLGA